MNAAYRIEKTKHKKRDPESVKTMESMLNYMLAEARASGLKHLTYFLEMTMIELQRVKDIDASPDEVVARLRGRY